MIGRSTLLAAMLALSVPLRAAAAQAPCSPQPVRGAPVDVIAPQATLHLRVADDPATREYGLMCVLALAVHTGMIFVFPGGDLPQEFWMKNTLIPLDMVWVRADGRVTTVAADVPATTVDTPDEAIPRRSGVGTFVIELAAGEAARDGIKAGAKLDVSRLGRAKD